MPVSGTKKAQIDRLFANPLTSEFGDESGKGWMSTADGKTVDDLKADCRAAGLVVGGVKYDLVMRLIKYKTAVAVPPPQTSAASPVVGVKRKAGQASKAEGKKRLAASAPSYGESGDDSGEESEEESGDSEEANAREYERVPTYFCVRAYLCMPQP